MPDSLMVAIDTIVAMLNRYAVRGNGKEAKASWCLYNFLLILWSLAHVHARGHTPEEKKQIEAALLTYDTLTDDVKRQQFSY